MVCLQPGRRILSDASNQESRQYTAFVTLWGVCEWLVLPMGLKSSRTAYPRMVAGCWERDGFTRDYGTKPYIDDMVHGTQDTERDRQSSSIYEGLSLSCIKTVSGSCLPYYGNRSWPLSLTSAR